MTRPSTSEQPNEALAEIDRAIAELLRRRCEITAALPEEPPRGRKSGLPRSLRTQEVVGYFCTEFGPPGELVARGILNLCRIALTEASGGRAEGR